MDENRLEGWFGGVTLVPCLWLTPDVAAQITAEVKRDLKTHYQGIPPAENVFLPARS